ncbi:hypothetical protein LTR78_007208 [Recurvomyces mirabilis]|uniref:Uncharacterized protein n=1 Tax=Recurvomyces mirabilis TaxID=574656 RepID=A0AAE1BYL0_9PEZI|nr:hypothetical protein LTR78_007208 [Recurvomyces mirabilis]KAK5155549.1 hypothetical protein LTS14_005810 [Recurvomyces mirabilis]
MERAVSRGELGSPASSPEPASDLELVKHIKEISEFDYVQTENAAPGHDERGHVDDDDLDFRLFSSSKPADATAAATVANKIRLRSPTPQNAEPGFMIPERPRRCYFQDASPGSVETYQAAALSSAEVLALSHKPCPGNEYPWKVLHLPSSSQAKSTSAQNMLFARLIVLGGEGSRKRKRLGKKARIRVRVKHATAKEQSEKAKADAASKGSAEKEKRARRNREKKLKKRAKGRAAKAAGGDAAGDGSGQVEDGSDSEENGE